MPPASMIYQTACYKHETLSGSNADIIDIKMKQQRLFAGVFMICINLLELYKTYLGT